MGRVPSIGRIIHVVSNGETIPAIITHVHTETCVNATAFNKNGTTTGRNSLTLAEATDLTIEHEWTWPTMETPVHKSPVATGNVVGPETQTN